MLQGPSGRSHKGGEGVQEGSVAPAGRKTLETLGAADSIAEALEMAANERKRHEVSLIFPYQQDHFVWFEQCSGRAAKLLSTSFFPTMVQHFKQRYALPEACSSCDTMQDYVKERQGDPSTKPPPPNPLMMGMDAGGYVLKAVGSVKVLVSSCVSLPISYGNFLTIYDIMRNLQLCTPSPNTDPMNPKSLDPTLCCSHCCKLSIICDS